MPVIEALFGYLKVSPEGFEYQRWPFVLIRGGWDEVEKVEIGMLSRD
jgi:hypothetical protein